MKISEKDLINFETDIANHFNDGKIKSPVHLYSGNEKQIIKFFDKKVKKNDWVFCSWRSHYQCILKGVPRHEVKSEILKGNSISLCFPKHKIYSSAIVGGIIPIATGLALSLKKSGKKQKVFCFVGDMTAESGIMHECLKYSINNKLPIHFIVEDNSLSVCSDTKKVWGMKKSSFKSKKNKYITYYQYKSIYPHAGAGIRVQF